MRVALCLFVCLVGAACDVTPRSTSTPSTPTPTPPAAATGATLSVADGRALSVSTPPWDPIVVAAIRALVVESQSRAAILADSTGVRLEYVPQGRGPFAVASLSKTLTALTVARLVDDGVVRFDEPVSETLPDWRGERGDITLRHLLSHTSGLNQSLQRVGPPDGPGEYNLRAYDVVADVLQRRTGQPLSALVNDKLVRPAGGDGVRWRALEGSELGFDAGGGPEATVDDLLAVGRVLLGGGFVGDQEVVRARSLDELWRAHGAVSRGFGAGLWLQYPRDNAMRSDIVEGRGGTGHMLSVVPDASAIFVRVGPGGNDRGVPERFHALLRQLRAPTLTVGQPESAAAVGEPP